MRAYTVWPDDLPGYRRIPDLPPVSDHYGEADDMSAPDIIQNLTAYSVTVDENRRVRTVMHSHYSNMDRADEFLCDMNAVGDRFYVFCFARDEDHAKKIAMRRIAQYLSSKSKENELPF